MNNKELQDVLKQYPDDMPIYLENKYVESVDAFSLEVIKLIDEVNDLFTMSMGEPTKGKALLLTD